MLISYQYHPLLFSNLVDTEVVLSKWRSMKENSMIVLVFSLQSSSFPFFIDLLHTRMNYSPLKDMHRTIRR